MTKCTKDLEKLRLFFTMILLLSVYIILKASRASLIRLDLVHQFGEGVILVQIH
jgi:hypothetical protein